jgi:hypothetical protein
VREVIWEDDAGVVDRWACGIENNWMCMVGEGLVGYADASMAMP